LRATSTPKNKALAESIQAIGHFIRLNNGWIIEGCDRDYFYEFVCR